jgi:glycosyltransferase involved in cell wall biosynthesis
MPSYVPTAYAGLVLDDHSIAIALFNRSKRTIAYEEIDRPSLPDNKIEAWVKEIAKRYHCAIVAMTIVHPEQQEKLGAHMWLRLDIVPFFSRPHVDKEIKEMAIEAAKRTASRFTEEDLIKVSLKKDREVGVSWLVRLADHERITDAHEFALLKELARTFKAKKNDLLFINSTPQGGGVALMRHAIIRLYRLLGISAHWHVMNGNGDVFNITKKKFHNILQGISPQGETLTENDTDLYGTWIENNIPFLKKPIERATVIVIDDPQPSGLIPYIKKYNPAAKIIYRSHIQIDTARTDEPETPQQRTWKFIWENAQYADVFVAHPIHTFIPKDVSSEKTVLMPATTDLLDGLNKRLHADQTAYYLSLFNNILEENEQKPLDIKRPFIIQIARFDPSKGIPDLLEAYRQLREKMRLARTPKNIIPQLVVVGHGAVDDPEGAPLYNETLFSLQMDRFESIADDIKVARLYPSDQILNALLRSASVALQLSYREGFEIKVTEALHMDVPVVAYRTGGIPLQIEDGRTGYLVPVGDTQKVAEFLYELTTQKEHAIRTNLRSYTPRFTTVQNAINWLYLANELIEHESIRTNASHIDELIKRDRS